jgi:CRP/FNR family cyclic AMP-dependent transcriptional regulator
MIAPDVLRRIPLFEHSERRQLKRIAQAMTERTFVAGETVATEGEPGVGFYIVTDGSATVSVRGRHVGTLRAGDHFGELGLIAELPRTATVRADTDLRCFALTSWDFRRLAESDVSIAWNLLEWAARKLHEAEQRA